MAKKKETAPKKKMVERYRVMKGEQWRDFETQYGAREHLIECLSNGAITFCSIKKVKVAEEDC